MTGRLICYTLFGGRNPTEPLWLAIVDGTYRSGGTGIVLAGSVPEWRTKAGVKLASAIETGQTLKFAGQEHHDEWQRQHPHERPSTEGATWGLDSDQVPAHVAAAWMRRHHTGKLNA